VKVLLWVLGIVVLLIVGAGVYLVMFSGNLLKDGIETYGPQFLGADVEVGAVELALAEGSGEVRGLRIGNPQGFSGPHAMRLNKIKIVLDPENLSEELVVLKQVEIDGAEIAAIAKGKATNLQQLMDNVVAAAGIEDSADDAGPEMKFIIDRLDFTNAKTSVSSDVLGDMSLEIPDIHLKDVGRASNGVTAAEAVKQLLAPIYKNVSSAMISQGLDLDVEGLKSNVKDEIDKKLGGGLKGLTDRFSK
jgi:uncharacterized protein involved in outer membrane biogenesis